MVWGFAPHMAGEIPVGIDEVLCHDLDLTRPFIKEFRSARHAAKQGQEGCHQIGEVDPQLGRFEPGHNAAISRSFRGQQGFSVKKRCVEQALFARAPIDV
jgi:hypothetical protein